MLRPVLAVADEQHGAVVLEQAATGGLEVVVAGEVELVAVGLGPGDEAVLPLLQEPRRAVVRAGSVLEDPVDVAGDDQLPRAPHRQVDQPGRAGRRCQETLGEGAHPRQLPDGTISCLGRFQALGQPVDVRVAVGTAPVVVGVVGVGRQHQQRPARCRCLGPAAEEVVRRRPGLVDQLQVDVSRRPVLTHGETEGGGPTAPEGIGVLGDRMGAHLDARVVRADRLLRADPAGDQPAGSTGAAGVDGDRVTGRGADPVGVEPRAAVRRRHGVGQSLRAELMSGSVVARARSSSMMPEHCADRGGKAISRRCAPVGRRDPDRHLGLDRVPPRHRISELRRG